MTLKEKGLNTQKNFAVSEAKWYIVRVHSGSEHRIVEDIKKTAELYGVPKTDFADFFVPSVSAEVFKNNAKATVKKVIYPGYIAIKMKMNEKSWIAVTKTDKVSGFLGGSRGKPTPLTESEYQDMVQNAQESELQAAQFANVSVGSRIKVKSGSFESFEGIVKSIDDKTSILIVSVKIFDRETTIELNPDQVEIINKD